MFSLFILLARVKRKELTVVPHVSQPTSNAVKANLVTSLDTATLLPLVLVKSRPP